MLFMFCYLIIKLFLFTFPMPACAILESVEVMIGQVMSGIRTFSPGKLKFWEFYYWLWENWAIAKVREL